MRYSVIMLVVLWFVMGVECPMEPDMMMVEGPMMEEPAPNPPPMEEEPEDHEEPEEPEEEEPPPPAVRTGVWRARPLPNGSQITQTAHITIDQDSLGLFVSTGRYEFSRFCTGGGVTSQRQFSDFICSNVSIDNFTADCARARITFNQKANGDPAEFGTIEVSISNAGSCNGPQFIDIEHLSDP